MNGVIRSVRYWLMNMEKVFLAMIGTVILMSVLLGSDEDLGVVSMLNLYLPMMGGIFAIAIMMSASTQFIPQSLSMGATRKDTFIGMEFVMHLVMLQTVLVAVIFNNVLPQPIWTTDFIIVSAILYLVCTGIGNAMCAGGLKLGNRAAMIIYVVMVMIVAVFAGVLGAMTGFKDGEMASVLMIFRKLWIVAIIFDVAMGAVCYMALRKHEVRA